VNTLARLGDDMKRIQCVIAVFAAMTVIGISWAGNEKEEPQLRLELDLVDGSHIIGVPSLESVPVQTSYAKMDIQLRQILTIRVEDDHEKASIDLRNGDKLKGVINLEPIKLQTIFGTVKIGVEHIKGLRVVLAGGGLFDELRKALVLYYSFDRDEGGQVQDQSAGGNDGEVHGAKWIREGKVGGAFSFNGDGNTVDVRPNCLDNLGDVTLNFWVKADRSVAYDAMVFSHYVNDDNGLDARIAGYGMQVCVGLGGKGDSPGSSVLDYGRWTHVAAVLGGGGARLYINGQPAAVNPNCKWSFKDLGRSVASTIGRTFLTRPHNGGPCWFKGELDEFMIFDRALSDSEVRQLYDAQK